MVDEGRRRQPEALPRPAAHRRGRGGDAVGRLAPRLAGAEPDRLGGDVGRVAQHVAQQRLERRAVADRQRGAVGARNHFGRRQGQPGLRRESDEDLAGVGGRRPHRQPVAAAPVHPAGRQRPDLAPVLEAVTDRPLADRAADAGDRHHELRARGAEHRILLRRPAHLHAVEVEVHPRERRVVAGVLRLVTRHVGHEGQGAVGDEEAALDALDAARLQGRHQLPEPVGVEHRIAAALEHQVAAQRPALDRPRRQQAGAEAVAGAERVERVERGDDLGDRGRRPADVCVVPFDELAGVEVGDGEAADRAEPGGVEDRGDRRRRGRGPGPAGQGRRRQRGGGPEQQRAAVDPAHRRPPLSAASGRAPGARSRRGRASAPTAAPRPAEPCRRAPRPTAAAPASARRPAPPATARP